ncbi:MAG: CDP-alcohol phosphatidyltransferase family protein [Planctomycetes bacterium]|nr:CDP-alcohol phosphatidyltransferase family protein [Planctomycetota bacterium]
MPGKRTDKARKRNLLRRVRRQRLEFITILPSLITLLNGICGFAAIGLASQGNEHFSFHRLDLPYLAWAGYLIFIAMIADMLDGRVARMSQATSSFGGQLDSLCDMISFGVAPAFLVVKFLDIELSAIVEQTPVLSDFVGRLIWFAAALYVACAAIRLARFNVENEEDETTHMSFLGLPTPAAAGVIASLVVFHQYLIETQISLPKSAQGSVLFAIVENAIIYALPFVAIGVAMLMISRIRYPHFVNQYFKGRKPLTHLFWSVGIGGLVYLCELPLALVIFACGFALSGFVKWCYLKIAIFKKRKLNVESPPLTYTHTGHQDH